MPTLPTNTNETHHRMRGPHRAAARSAAAPMRTARVLLRVRDLRPWHPSTGVREPGLEASAAVEHAAAHKGARGEHAATQMLSSAAKSAARSGVMALGRRVLRQLFVLNRPHLWFSGLAVLAIQALLAIIYLAGGDGMVPNPADAWRPADNHPQGRATTGYSGPISTSDGPYSLPGGASAAREARRPGYQPIDPTAAPGAGQPGAGAPPPALPHSFPTAAPQKSDESRSAPLPANGPRLGGPADVAPWEDQSATAPEGTPNVYAGANARNPNSHARVWQVPGSADSSAVAASYTTSAATNGAPMAGAAGAVNWGHAPVADAPELSGSKARLKGTIVKKPSGGGPR